MRSLHEELPYALTVEIEKLEREAKIVRIEAVIWVERDGQKAIVIGADGARSRSSAAPPAASSSNGSARRCS